MDQGESFQGFYPKVVGERSPLSSGFASSKDKSCLQLTCPQASLLMASWKPYAVGENEGIAQREAKLRGGAWWRSRRVS